MLLLKLQSMLLMKPLKPNMRYTNSLTPSPTVASTHDTTQQCLGDGLARGFTGCLSSIFPILHNQSFIPPTLSISCDLRLPPPTFIHVHKSSICLLALQLYFRLLSAHPFITPLLIPHASAFRSQIYQKQSETMKVAGKPIWDKPIDVDEKWIQFVDDNVLASEPRSLAKPSRAK